MLCMNAVEHYKGNHTNWLHAPYKSRIDEMIYLPKWAVLVTEEKFDALRIFLNAPLKCLKNVGARYSARRNERFHCMKAQMACRDICQCYGWKIRVVIGKLKVNGSYYFIALIVRFCGLVESAKSKSVMVHGGLRWIQIEHIKSNGKQLTDVRRRGRSKEMFSYSKYS